jgi:hypothetical protein
MEAHDVSLGVFSSVAHPAPEDATAENAEQSPVPFSDEAEEGVLACDKIVLIH